MGRILKKDCNGFNQMLVNNFISLLFKEMVYENVN